MTTLPVTFMLEPRYKEQFAAFLDAGFSAFLAAQRIWPTDPGLCAQVANNWPHDEYVQAVRALAKDAKEAAAKPATKDAQVKRIETRLTNMGDDAYLKGERLIAEMLGHIEKAAPPSIAIDNRVQTIERVMTYKDFGTDEEWEAKSKRQQGKLIEGNVDHG